jgi:hypothetical protein
MSFVADAFCGVVLAAFACAFFSVLATASFSLSFDAVVEDAVVIFFSPQGNAGVASPRIARAVAARRTSFMKHSFRFGPRSGATPLMSGAAFRRNRAGRK